MLPIKNYKYLCSFLLVILCPAVHHAQCSFYSDYASNLGWTQIGSEVEIFNGKVNFINGAKCREFQKRVQAPLGKTIHETDCWEATIQFTPTAVGVKNNRPYAGHVILGLTAGTNSFHFDCPDPPCTGHNASSQDGFLLIFAAQNPPTGSLFFFINAKDSTNETTSQRINALPLGTTQYLKLKKEEANKIELSIFSDSSFTNHVPGSPVVFSYSGSVDGLTHVQHGNTIRGELRRQLTGTVDNLCINWEPALQAHLNWPTDSTICAGDSIFLNIGHGADADYLWSNGSTDSAISIQSPGMYWATVTKGCHSFSDTIIVRASPTLQPQLSPVSACIGEPVKLTYAAQNASFLWNTGETSATIFPTNSGYYGVEVVTDCDSIYDEVYVAFTDCSCEMKLPNVFSPNGDGQNEYFTPVSYNENCNITLKVFNRWGSLVFETTEHNFKWDGKNVAAGTYFWILSYTDLQGNEQRENGTVTIFK